METYSQDLVNALKSIVFDCNWQLIGKASSFKPLKCYRVYSLDDIDEDILLIKDKNGKFYAIEARCAHEGGPLDEGDIEELADKLYIVCPWHSFDFDLNTGISSTGLKQQTYDIRIVDDDLYINTAAQLSLTRPTQDKPQETRSNETKSELVTSSPIDEETKTLSYWAVKILQTPNPKEKADLTDLVARKWLNNELDTVGQTQPPEQPERLENLNVVDPAKIRRGKGGTLASRIALLHSLANIEQWAMDLSWDIIARFANTKLSDQTSLPKQFFTDFIKVACDEAKHYRLLEKRLIELNSHFGALSVHNGLWESATETKHSLLARLAIVHMVHEARGLDVHPQTRLRFLNQKDDESVKLLDILYEDEITHVAAGIKWFQYVCDKEGHNFIETFHSLVKSHFKGYLKPPFDTEGRKIAGFSEEWYLPLVKPNQALTQSDQT